MVRQAHHERNVDEFMKHYASQAVRGSPDPVGAAIKLYLNASFRERFEGRAGRVRRPGLIVAAESALGR